MADNANIDNRDENLNWAVELLGNAVLNMMSDAFETFGASRPNPWLIACDHASNRVPEEIGTTGLGLPAAEMARHIAYDIGALGVTRALVAELGAVGLASRFSRLVIDPNRGLRDPTLIMQVYDRTIIPGNRALTPAQRQDRIDQCYKPYHDTFSDLAKQSAGTLIITVHSFTPSLKDGALRPWHVGILYHDDHQSLSRPLINRLRAERDLVIGENEPYAGHLPGDTMDRQAIQTNRPNALIELRSDLIETTESQMYWGKRLAHLLEAARKDANL